MNITGRIIELSNEWASATGITPHNVYLGHSELTELLDWAEHSEYINGAATTKTTGDDRPEVNGMKIFEVNAENHLACGI